MADRKNVDPSDKLSLRLRSYYCEARELHAWNRQEMWRDADYVDSIQLEEDMIRALQARGQAPVAINEVKPAVDWIVGSERRTKTEWKVLGRGPEDAKNAQIKTGVLKYLFDVNNVTMARSRAFAQAVTSGLGWLECGIRPDGDEGEPLFIRFEDWRNVWVDPVSVEPDLSDARYVCRAKWVEADTAHAEYPGASELLAREMGTIDDRIRGDGDLFSDDPSPMLGQAVRAVSIMSPGLSVAQFREMVRLVEVWYRSPEKVSVVAAGPLAGQMFVPGADPMMDALRSVQALPLREVTRQRVRVAVMLPRTGFVLTDEASRYRHNQFPFVPIYGYRRDRDKMPYGVVRTARDPQDVLNRAISRAIWEMSARRVKYKKNSVESRAKLAEQAARPDGLIEIKADKDMEDVQFEDRASLEFANSHLALANRVVEHIRSASGVTGENRGEQTNAQSGVAVQARQMQGSVVTTALFDNLLFAMQRLGRLTLSLVEQFYTDQRVMRVSGGAADQFIRTNTVAPDGSIDHDSDLARSAADFWIAEQDFRESARQAQADQLMQALAKLPGDVSIKLLDLAVEMMDLPSGDEFVRRIRLLNGMPDPADQHAVEQSQAGIAAQAAEARKVAQLEQGRLMAEVRKLIAQALQAEATAQRTRTEAARTAMEVGAGASMNPSAAVAGDALLGHIDSGTGTAMPPAPVASPPDAGAIA